MASQKGGSHAHARINEVSALRRDRGTFIGLEGLLAAMITGTWTAFETMAGDLWEMAINVHPNRFAELGGNCSRIKNKVEQKYRRHLPDGQEPKKNLSLSTFAATTKNTFNLQNQMGSFHREHSNVKFDSLASIRAAYSAAFQKHYVSVDNALSAPALDTLSLIRNLLVHRAGVADQQYINSSKRVPGCPRLGIKDKFELKGDRIARIVMPAINASMRLLAAVDAEVRRP